MLKMWEGVSFMRVLMITNNYKGCGYVRFKLPAWNNGFELAETKEEVRDKVENADVVVFHRPESIEHYNLAEMLKKKGKKIVMDNDDTFRLSWHPLCQFTPEAVEVSLKQRAEAIERFIGISDLVTTTTEMLAKEYRERSDNVVILPNCIDPMDWNEPLRNEGDKVRIGLVGSATMEYDYIGIRGLLRELSDRKDVQLFMFGLGDAKHRAENPKVVKAFQDDYDFWDSLNIEHQPWCDIDDYPAKLNESRLDIMLIPRKDNYFNRCKSNVKFLEASMCEIPVIAQSFSDAPYEELRGHNMGILVEDNKDWKKQVDKLIDDKELRREMGRNAKEYVLSNYNIEVRASEWEDAYSKMYEEN